jgi:hypothetical protein
MVDARLTRSSTTRWSAANSRRLRSCVGCADVCRNSQLYGETRYFAAIHERLARPELADPEINLYSWHLALASDAPRDSLLLALESMDDLVERDFDPAYRDTLATLNYRLGNFPEAVQIARGIWDRAPKAWSASQLARFYEGWLNAGNIRGSDLPETISLETNQVESQLHYLSDDREVELRVALTESRSNSSNIHILLYKSDGLQGFVNVPLGAGKNYKSCRFDASNFGRIGTTARPVWVGHRESDTALPADACLLYWMTPMAKVMP